MIRAYMRDDLTILVSDGFDSFGEPESGHMISVRGYVDWKSRLVIDIKGDEVFSSVKILFHRRSLESALGRRLTHADKIWIDGESHERTIVRIDRPKAMSRPHYEVYLA